MSTPSRKKSSKSTDTPHVKVTNAQVAISKTGKSTEQLHKDIKRLTTENRTLKEDNERLQKLQKDPSEFLKEEFQKVKEELTAENKKLTEEIERLKSQTNQVPVLENKPKTEKSNYIADNSAGRGSKDDDKETDKLRRDFDKEREAHKSTQQKLEMERRKNNEMQERLDKSESLKVSSERENKENIDRLRGELDGEKEAHISTKKDLQRLSEDNKDLRGRLKSQTNQVPVTENETKTKQANAIADKSADRESKERDAKIDQLKRELDEEKKTHKSTTETLQKEREKYKSELGKLQGDLDDVRKAHTSTQKELETGREKYKSELGKLQGDLDDVKKLHKSTQKELETISEQHKSEVLKLQEKFDVEKKAHKSTQRELETLQNSPKHGKQNQPESEVVKNLKNEVDSLKNRLSQVAGTKLTEGNPNIADLSDSNRPINLAEKFSELYDNEWTDAYEEVMENNGDEATIEILLGIVKGAFEFCQKQSLRFLEEMKKGLQVIDVKGDEKNWAPGISKQLKDLRKSLSVLVVGNIQKKYHSDRKTSNFKEHTKKYIDACVRICWFMSVQDPPVVIDAATPSGKFDGDKYRAYTKTGNSYKYLVWPIMYLHENGPMLGKGIAQGK